MNIKLILFLILIPFLAISHEINIEDKSVDEVVKQRMANMSKIKAYSSKMYPMTIRHTLEIRVYSQHDT